MHLKHEASPVHLQCGWHGAEGTLNRMLPQKQSTMGAVTDSWGLGLGAQGQDRSGWAPQWSGFKSSANQGEDKDSAYRADLSPGSWAD